MNLYGLQKLTLLDYPGKTAATVFTGGCNLRCPFCHNASLVLDGANKPQPVSDSVFFRFLEKRKGLLDGVCISGGEPLLHSGLADFAKKIKSLGFLVKLDTNGTFPEKLRRLVDAGLVDYVAMDVKNSPAFYSITAGISGFDFKPIAESIAYLKTGAVDYEFRTTIVKGLHTADSLLSLAQEIAGAERYFLQKFVDSGNLIGSNLSPFSDEEMENFLKLVSPYVKFSALRGI